MRKSKVPACIIIVSSTPGLRVLFSPIKINIDL